MTSSVPGGVTALIHTRNEVSRVGYTIRSVRPWVDEVVVVDMESQDGTQDLARSLGARVESTPNIGYADPARAAAAESVTTEWAFYLDADEVVPRPLADRLVQIAVEDSVDAVLVPRLNYFMGRPLLTTDWGFAHDRHVRFWRRGHLVFSPTVHVLPAVRPDSRVLELPREQGLALHHFLYEDFSHYLRKLDQYTDFEAEELLRTGRPLRARDALSSGMREFLRRWVKNKGYQEDYRAFAASALMISYRLVAWAKAAQLQDIGDREDVRSEYARVAEALVQEYGDGPL